MTYKDYVSILTERSFDAKSIGIPYQTLRYLEGIRAFNPQDYMKGNPNELNIFGVVKARIFQSLKSLGFSKGQLLQVRGYFDQDLMVAKCIPLTGGSFVYNYPITQPVMFSLAGLKHYFTVNHEGGVEFLTEERLVELIVFGASMGDYLHSKVILDVSRMVSESVPLFKGKGFLKKIGKILENAQVPLNRNGEYCTYKTEYYTNIRQLGSNFTQILSQPDTEIVAKSNDKGSVTSIKVRRKKVFDNLQGWV